MSSIVLDEEVSIPFGIDNLESFREWCLSESFPENVRIDFIDGSIEVEMPPENQGSHGSPKSEISSFLHRRLKELGEGKVFIDRMRYTCPDADLSVEPDVLYVSYEALRTGRARFVPSRTEPGDFVEIEGAADLVVELVSRGSVSKDTRRLPPRYFRAGVREYWLVDARGRELKFSIHRRGRSGFVRVRPNKAGFQRSDVLGGAYRLVRRRDPVGLWEYDLLEQSTDDR